MNDPFSRLVQVPLFRTLPAADPRRLASTLPRLTSPPVHSFFLKATMATASTSCAQTLCDRLFQTLTAYRGAEPAFDDVTLVAIQAVD